MSVRYITCSKCNGKGVYATNWKIVNNVKEHETLQRCRVCGGKKVVPVDVSGSTYPEVMKDNAEGA